MLFSSLRNMASPAARSASAHSFRSAVSAARAAVLGSHHTAPLVFAVSAEAGRLFRAAEGLQRQAVSVLEVAARAARGGDEAKEGTAGEAAQPRGASRRARARQQKKGKKQHSTELAEQEGMAVDDDGTAQQLPQVLPAAPPSAAVHLPRGDAQHARTGAASPPAYAEGQVVIATGLAARPDFNGMRGVITGHDTVSKRYMVRFPAETNPVRVREVNLRESIFPLEPGSLT